MFTKPPTQSSLTLQLQDAIEFPSAGINSTLLKSFGVSQYQMLCLTASAVIPGHTSPHHTVIHAIEGHGVLTLNRNKIQLEPNVIVFVPACVSYSLQAVSNLALLMTLSQVEV